VEKMSFMITFSPKTNDLFLASLRKEVQEYFVKSKKKSTATTVSVLKLLILFSLRIILYASILFGCWILGFWPLNWICLGFVEILIAFNVGHDAIHGSFSSIKRVNSLLGYLSYDWIGFSSKIWHQTHNLGHHIFTNIYQVDPDISKPGILRLSPHDPKYPIHRFQHLYAWLLYGFVGISWFFYGDWVCLWREKNKWTFQEKVAFVFWKAFALCYFIVIPTLVSPLSFSQVILGYLLTQFICGLSASIVFQLAHVVEGVEFPLPEMDGNIEMSWGEHEVRTTANFATDRFLTTLFLGGLNFQIEHHLFPHISHGHYPTVSKFVKKACIEKRIPYHEKRSMMAAVCSHFNFLKRLGSRQCEQEIPNREQVLDPGTD
jgi:linoleoyl-CoA desaturase